MPLPEDDVIRLQHMRDAAEPASVNDKLPDLVQRIQAALAAE